eukprot:19777-Heterococcus_DN1.PRE.2
MLLSLLWGCAVTAAAAHCTAAGAVAGWWFSGATSSGGYSGNGQVANGHVSGSLRRAATTSLGSLCLAALLTAVARWLRLAVNGLKRQRRGMGSLAGGQRANARMCSSSCYMCTVRSTYSQAAGPEQCSNSSASVIWLVHGLQSGVSCDECGDGRIAHLARVTYKQRSGVVAALHCTAALAQTHQLHQLEYVHLLYSHTSSISSLRQVSSALATVYVCFAQDPDAFAASHHELWAELMHSWNKAHGPAMAACGYTLATQAA